MIYSYFKDSAFTAVKRDVKFYTRYVKGVPFVCQKWYIKGLGEPPRIKFCSVISLFSSGIAEQTVKKYI